MGDRKRKDKKVFFSKLHNFFIIKGRIFRKPDSDSGSRDGPYELLNFFLSLKIKKFYFLFFLLKVLRHF